MPRIKIVPSETLSCASRLDSNLSRLNDVSLQISSASSRLNWSVKSKSNIDSRIQDSLNKSKNLSSELSSLSSYIKNATNRLVEADKSGDVKLSKIADNYKKNIDNFRKTSLVGLNESEKEDIISIKESSIRDEKLEHCIILTGESSILLEREGFESEGGDHSIVFTEAEGAQITEGSILIHNHPIPPGNSGSSFSFQDMVFASGYKLKEIRAVNDVYKYSLKPNVNRGWPEREDILESYQNHTESIYSDIVRQNNLNLFHKDYITRKQAEEIFQHEIIKAVAKDFGLIYERVEW